MAWQGIMSSACLAGKGKRLGCGALPSAIAKEFGCCESRIYADMRENEKRLAAMLFAREE